jgi:diguanylate cyclase (GGDEF)-like protein
MSLLVVDDSAVNRRVLEATLRVEGFAAVHSADSAEEAFRILRLNERVKNTDIEIVLMDVLMPGIDGFEACRRIKQAPEFADLPVIIVTAMAERDSIEAAFEAGASDYISRPISRVELHARLKLALTVRREKAERQAREAELLEMSRKLEAANRQLLELSRTDALTGVANRRSFDDTLELECRRCRRATHKITGPEHLSLLMIDVDHFKAYNDLYGHPGGDRVLTRVAAAMKAALRRPSDFIARYGGEEFAVILPETSPEGALMVAERLREAVEELGIAHAQSSAGPHVTVSIGAASSNMPEALGLMLAADNALYEAKHAGRNRAHGVSCESVV